MEENIQGSQVSIPTAQAPADQRKGLISRMGFFRLGVGVTLATEAAISGRWLFQNEANIAREGIETAHGRFIFRYNIHSHGLTADQIPDNAAAVGRELMWGEGYMKDSPSEVLLGVSQGSDTFNTSQTRIYPDEVIKKAASNGTNLLVGLDVSAETSEGQNLNNSILLGLHDVKALGDAVALAFMNKLGRQNTETGRVTWRQKIIASRLMRTLTGLDMLWNASPQLTYFADLAGLSTNEQGAVNRIASRSMGISSDIHPEQIMGFIRNLVMVNKLFTVSEELYRQSKELYRQRKVSKIIKPVIVMEAEGGHSGMEDLLGQGHRFCRDLLTQIIEVDWVRNYLQVIDVATPNELIGLTSYRMIKLAPGTTTRKDAEGNLQLTADPLEDNIITDQVLENMLLKTYHRLSSTK